MSEQEQIEFDIAQYLEKESNLTENDKRQYLRAMFEKHFAFRKLDHLLNYHDLHDIISNAKSRYNDVKSVVSRKQLYPTEVAHTAMIEAVISYLNSKGLSVKIVKIDYTER
jgi:Flp pilus assembly CpaF family ATPase